MTLQNGLNHWTMKYKVLLSIALATMMAASCGISTRTAISRIEPGMSETRIKNMLGKPDLRRFDKDGKEEWEYHRYSGHEENTVIVIRFSDGRVSGMDSFKAKDPAIPHPMPPVDIRIEKREHGKPHTR